MIGIDIGDIDDDQSEIGIGDIDDDQSTRL
jgi:hypothetical protein